MEMEFTTFVELYAARKKLRKMLSGKCMFMEDIAKTVLNNFGADKVTVRLMFNKHKVIISKDPKEV